ncbi:Hypothetical protein APM_1576 [Acidiphilium sp. PM]|nr:Hypothetical protein APM_1576 [Acidiphilium sp. PM]
MGWPQDQPLRVTLPAQGGTERRRNRYAALGVQPVPVGAEKLAHRRCRGPFVSPLVCLAANIPTHTRHAGRIRYGLSWDNMGDHGRQRDFHRSLAKFPLRDRNKSESPAKRRSETRAICPCFYFVLEAAQPNPIR